MAPRPSSISNAEANAAEVIIPWHPGDPHRERAFKWVRDHLPYAVRVATCDPWNKSQAVVDCLSRLNSEFVILHDADVWCEDLSLAVSAVMSGYAWAIPHYYVYRLAEKATKLFLTTGVAEVDYQRPPYEGIIGGGLLVARTEVLRDCPPDPRFVGWGGEDMALGEALWTLYGRAWRGKGRLLHLYHELQPRITSKWGSEANRRLYQEVWHAANGNEADMRAVVEEAKRIEKAKTVQ